MKKETEQGITFNEFPKRFIVHIIFWNEGITSPICPSTTLLVLFDCLKVAESLVGMEINGNMAHLSPRASLGVQMLAVSCKALVLNVEFCSFR